MIFLWNKKILNLCFIWHILRSYRFVAEVTFKDNSLNIAVGTNLYITEYLDVMFNLRASAAKNQRMWDHGGSGNH